MASVSKMVHKGKSIIVVDYSDADEQGMLRVLKEAEELFLNERDCNLLLSIFNERNFTTPTFMLNAETVVSRLLQKIEKQAIVGLNAPKKIILKGFNLVLNRNFKAFDTREEALAYLVSDAPEGKFSYLD
jgi:hypothetical protein